jgi:ubiquinone/menaquinone biosynthesis C-methylase UbiE
MLKCLIGGPVLYNPYFKTFGLKGNEKVLDFGCGGGAGSRCLAKLLNTGGHLTCIDISNYWMKKASRRLGKYPNVECKAGDIRSLGIPDNSFDVISVFHVIHDIAPEERREIVTVLCQKLKRNGTVFIREPVKKSHGMPVMEIRTLFADAGFQEADCQESKSEYRGKFRPASASIGSEVVKL